MLWSEIFSINKKCKHPNVPIEQDIYYCPDCGELVENRWYLVRCSCCGMKLVATIRNDEVVPEYTQSWLDVSQTYNGKLKLLK